ncbi:MAG: LysR family transcriptional regulator [Candidatus Omnitrophica bacterium]|nr:LysR family transcriptional regulator [Candidatus Omnitrophota bacterium]
MANLKGASLVIDLFYLKTFVAVTKTRSFRVAAERNFITQPAVSQHIRVLEKKLGTALFERRGRNVVLTHAGETFLPYAENILKQYEEAQTRVRELDNKFSGTIRIATIYSVGLYELKAVVQKFQKKYPQVNLHLEYQKNAAIYEMVLNRAVDFGMVSFPQKRNGIVAETFAEDELVLAQSPQKRFLHRKTIDLKEIAGVGFIAFAAATPTGKVIQKFFTDNKIQPNILHEYDNIELIKSAVVLGLGCALLPRKTVAREVSDKTIEVLRVRGLSLQRPIGVLYPAGKVFTKTSRTFYEMLTQP